MPDRCAKLEISLSPRGNDRYSVSMRFYQADGAVADGLLDRNGTTLIHHEILLELQGQPDRYGEQLTKDFFADSRVRKAFLRARERAGGAEAPLRIQLAMDEGRLHSIFWETLCDPETKAPLFTGERVYLSRTLSSNELRAVPARPRSEATALALAANGSDMFEYGLPPLDVAKEMHSIRGAMGSVPVRELPSGEDRPTLQVLIDRLRDWQPDILIIIAHGKFGTGGKPYIFLESADGRAHPVAADEMTERIGDLKTLPRLVVLVSCQSGGPGDSGDPVALGAIGPLLVRVGVPAVVAMQGVLSTETAEQWLPKFLHELAMDGQIDRALAVARGQVSDCHGWWMPTLFTRLTDAHLWSDQTVTASSLVLEGLTHVPADPVGRSVPAITGWINRNRASGLDLKEDPFGPVEAEREPFLVQLVVKPPDWDTIKSTKPTVVLGASGSGRTAACLLLEHECNGSSDRFPVSLELKLGGEPLSSGENLMVELTRTTLKSLIEFFAHHPHDINNTSPNQRRAIGRLYLQHKNEMGELSECLVGAGMEDRAVARALADALLQGLQTGRNRPLKKRTDVQRILGDARPGNRRQSFLLIELSNNTREHFSPSEIAAALPPLLNAMAPLADTNVIIKLFLPANLTPHLQLGHLNEPVVRLQWSASSLTKMLERRMQSATGYPDFGLLFQRLPDGAEPARSLVAAALMSEGAPRQLVVLGRKILLSHIRQRPASTKLNWDDFLSVLEDAPMRDNS